MEEELRDLRAELVMLRGVTGALWSNFLAKGSADPTAEAERLGREMRADLGTALRRPARRSDPALEETILNMQDRLESFWRYVRELLARNLR